MKPIQKSTEVTNIITIKNKVYKFTTETYYLKEQRIISMLIVATLLIKILIK